MLKIFSASCGRHWIKDSLDAGRGLSGSFEEALRFIIDDNTADVPPQKHLSLCV